MSFLTGFSHRFTYHRNNLGLHFPNSREDIRVNRVRNAKLAKSLRLKFQKVHASMIHSTAHPAIFPARVLHISEFPELLTDLLWTPTFLRKCKIPVNVRASRHKLFLQILQGSLHLLVDLAAHTGGAQKDRVTEQAEGEVDIADATEEAVAAEGVKGLAGVAEEEEYKYNVADTVECLGGFVSNDLISPIRVSFAGKVQAVTYRSRFTADRWALDARP